MCESEEFYKNIIELLLSTGQQILGDRNHFFKNWLWYSVQS